MNFKNILLILTILLSAVLSINTVHADVGTTLIWDATAAQTLTINRGETPGFVALFESLGERANYKVELRRNNVAVGPVIFQLNNQAGEHHAYQLNVQPGQYNRISGLYTLRSTITGLTTGRIRTYDLLLNVVNQAPVINVNDKSVYERNQLQFTVSATDANNDALTYRATNVPGGATFNPATQQFLWTPNFTQAGSYQVIFSVSDGESTTLKTITITVYNVNRNPIMNPLSDQVVDEGNLLRFTVRATDADNEVLTYSAVSVPSGATFNPATQTFTWTPNFTQAGVYSVTFRATDGTAQDSKTVRITVNNVNQAPVLDPIADQTVAEGTLLRFTVHATDVDNDAIVYRLNSVPTGVVFDRTTGAFTWTPNYDQDGVFRLTFSATDGTATVSQIVTITVTDSNRAPLFNVITDKTVAEGTLLQFTVHATDVDSDVLTYSAVGLPLGALFNPATQTFTWTPDFTQAGSYLVTFNVNDGTITTSQVVAITVINVNRVPVFDALVDQTVAEGTLLQFTVHATDADSDALTYSATTVPGAIFDPATQIFTWTPNYDQAGIYSLTFTVSDGTIADSQTITITVTNVNRAPVLNPIGNKVVDELVNLNFPVTATDPDSDAVVVTATNLPSGATFVAGIFSWTPDRTQSGVYTVTFTVTDSVDTSSEVITITVNDIDRAPVIAPIGNRVVNEGTHLNFSVTATDVNNDVISLTTSVLPFGATFVGGVFDWTPDFTQTGVYTVTFTATDSNSMSSSETITITVTNVNRAPVLNPIGNKVVDELVNLNFPVTATDPDSDAVVVTATNLPSGATFVAGIFSWTPDRTQSGVYTVTFTVTDSVDTSSEVITITVNDIDRAPVIAPIGNRVVNEGTHLNFPVTATDVNNDVISLTTS